MAAPAYWITYDDRPNYLLARVQGTTDSLEVSISFWQEIAQEATERQVKRLLVHESFRNNVSAIDILEVGQFLGELAEMLDLRSIKIAFVDERLEQLDRNRLGELVAVNRGLRGKVFADFAEAERWLLAD